MADAGSIVHSSGAAQARLSPAEVEERLVAFAALGASARTSAFAGGHGAGFVDHQRPAHQVQSMADFDSLGSQGIVVDFDKSKAPSLACETIAHNGDGVDRNSMIGKELLDLGFVRRIRKISDKKLFHFKFLLKLEAAAKRHRARVRDLNGGTDQQTETPT